MNSVLSSVNDLSPLISALASCISGFVGWQVWKVSRNMYNLQNAIEIERKPLVYLWSNGVQSLTPNVECLLSFVNIGKESLPIKEIEILDGETKEKVEFFVVDKNVHEKNESVAPRDSLKSWASDIMIEPNHIYYVFIRIQSSKAHVHITYYDEFKEEVEIYLTENKKYQLNRRLK